MLEARNSIQTLTPELTPTPPERSSHTPTSNTPPLNNDHLLLPVRPQIPLPTPPPQDLIFAPWSSVDAFSDVISKGIVTYAEAEEYLRSFRLKTLYFPYVFIPVSTTVDMLRKEKSFLLLSIILLGCSQTFNSKQKLLEVEFLEVFAKRSVVQGEKSLDLLQGMLVYVGQ